MDLISRIKSNDGLRNKNSSRYRNRAISGGGYDFKSRNIDSWNMEHPVDTAEKGFDPDSSIKKFNTGGNQTNWSS